MMEITKMYLRWSLIALLLIMLAGMLGCGSSELEENMVFHELELVAEKNVILSKELDQSTKENLALSEEISRLQDQIDALQEENKTLKARFAMQ